MEDRLAAKSPGQKGGKPQAGLGQWDERIVQLCQIDRISKIS